MGTSSKKTWPRAMFCREVGDPPVTAGQVREPGAGHLTVPGEGLCLEHPLRQSRESGCVCHGHGAAFGGKDSSGVLSSRAAGFWSSWKRPLPQRPLGVAR